MLKFKKYPHSGFTLLELLVVVLIIGILAAIALPQYKLAVARSKYNSIKEMTESIAQSVERYYLAKSICPETLEGLDIDIPGEYTNNNKIRKILPTGYTCGFNSFNNSRHELICFTSIFGKQIAYLSVIYYSDNTKQKRCYAFSENTNDLVNKVCQVDTGKKTPYSGTCSNYCEYRY